MGLLVCSGIPIDDIIDIVCSVRLRDLVNIDLSMSGCMRLDKLEEVMKKHIVYRDLADLPIPLYVSTTDLKSWHNIIYQQGKIMSIIKASCSIPFSFKAVCYGRRILVDGGVTNNFPVEPFLEGYDCTQTDPDHVASLHRGRGRSLLIGVDVNPYKHLQKNSLPHIIPRSITLLIQQSYMLKKHFCDYYLQPQKLQDISIFQTHDYQHIIDIGYNTAENQWWSVLW